jgi:hypothetical protein
MKILEWIANNAGVAFGIALFMMWAVSYLPAIICSFRACQCNCHDSEEE